MNTYIYRDARLKKLSDALARLNNNQIELRKLIEDEQNVLHADNWLVTDRAYLAVAADWLWSTGLKLKALVDDDPVFLALNKTATLTDTQATAIANLPHIPGGPAPDYLDQVRIAIGQNPVIFTELLHAAHRRWIFKPSAERLYPFDDVGVLLPLRLETLFDEPSSRFNDDPIHWKLSLRVIPDEASICRDNAYVSDGEKKALIAFWQAIKQPGNLSERWLDGDAAGIAWKQLCDRVTPPRAAWLVATVETRFENEMVELKMPAEMPDRAQPNRVGGMPPELRVFVFTSKPINGITHHDIGRLPKEESKQIDSNALTLPLPKKQVEEKMRWWASWEAAKAVGLGDEWLLPEGVTPQTIDALYVVGIGDEPPDIHFKAQADAGELGVLQLGTSTNTVHGKTAADLSKDATDWRKVAQIRLRQRLNPQWNLTTEVGRILQQQLIGNSNILPFFPGADAADETKDSKRMVSALWPALWGHWLHDFWQGDDDVFRVGLWAFDYLYPEGPLMPLRISDQPYGLLPVTALSQWTTEDAFSEEQKAQKRTETVMVKALNKLRSAWADAAKKKGTVVGKSSSEFIELLGQDALSCSYIWREFIPAWALIAPYQLTVDKREDFLQRARAAYIRVKEQFEQIPDTPYLASGYWRRNYLPLIQPTRMLYHHRQGEMRKRLPLSTFLSLLFNFSLNEKLDNYDLEQIFQRWWVLDPHGEYQLGTLPDSLLIRLLTYACQITFPWRRTFTGSYPQQHLLEIQQKTALSLAKIIDNAEWYDEEQDPFNGQPVFILKIPDGRRLQLERALCATLDSAAHRIDPWITGFAWQRLQQHSNSPRHAHRLGVYGWVDGPFIGRSGPTDAGRLHAPSYNQTLAAIILRDKFLSSVRAASTNDSKNNPWEMNITASKVRLAEEIADEVRMGFHIYEIVGRHVENVIDTHQNVELLRTNPNYAMHPERPNPYEVCNGINALLGLLEGKLDSLLSNDLKLKANQQAALQLLHDALDTYGDLLMADGIMQLANRQVERAAETMEAAAGFSRPPSFEFIRTPPSGYQLESVVLSTLPFVAINDLGNNTHPIRLADPSVAAFLENKLGPSTDWIWNAISETNGALLGTITLQQLGLTPIDTLALSSQFLGDLALHKLALTQVRIVAPRQHQLAQQLVAALGNRPAAGRDFTENKITQAAIDAEIYEELRNRYEKLYSACVQLIADLHNANNDASHVIALRQALIWGVTPISKSVDQKAFLAALTGTIPPTEATPLIELTKRAAKTLEERLNAAPKPIELAAKTQISLPLSDQKERKQKNLPDGIPTLAQAIANLASPNAKLAILACWPQKTLIENTKLVTKQIEPTLDETWLTIVAPTRANLARLEALQLEMNPPLNTWSSSPDDPWQSECIKMNLAKRDKESPVGLQMPRFVAAYGVAKAWEVGKNNVAVGLIDAFNEAISMPQRNTMAAFGFNAPSSRPPQAILLAVPPKPRQRLDNNLLLQIVEETRELAHARTARIEDLGNFQAMTPTMWLQSSGPIRIRLEPWPLFEKSK